jgi:hypothetical protein
MADDTPHTHIFDGVEYTSHRIPCGAIVSTAVPLPTSTNLDELVELLGIDVDELITPMAGAE